MKPSKYPRTLVLVLAFVTDFVTLSILWQPASCAEPRADQLPPAIGLAPIQVVAGTEFARLVRIKVGGEQVLLSDAIDRALEDRQLAMYRQLRLQHGNTALGQSEIAKWCRKHGLSDEERLHWQILLQMQPDHADAIKGLKLRKYKGRLLTDIGIKKAKQEEKLAREAGRKWGPQLAQIKLAIEQGDAEERRAAMGELEAIDDPHAMGLIEKQFSDGPTEVGLLVVEMYARVVSERSTEALARLAIHAENSAVRNKAASELRYRPVDDYIPLLLSALAAPIELSLKADFESGRPTFRIYEARVNTGRLVPGLYGVIRLSGNYSNRDVLCWGFETKHFSGLIFAGYRPDRHQYEYVLSRDSPDPDAPYEFRGGFAVNSSAASDGRVRESVRRSFETLQKRIQESNAAAAKMNQRIDTALREALDDSASPAAVPIAADARPRLWWDWWKKHLNWNNYLVGGTEVWTQFGILPIERIIVGDRVLTKDLSSGELEFNLVIGMDTQPTRKVRELEVGTRTIVATPDQPFFVTDAGWREAENLEVGMEIDSLDGPQRIKHLRSGKADAAYSLLIANLPNYFVERQGILVHDATRQR